jgi:hypothetical protein
LLRDSGFETLEHCGGDGGVHLALEIGVDGGDERALFG